jgi:arylsulfatase A-like enzyme
MWPGQIPPGQAYEGLATQMDWFPTFCKLAGADLPGDRVIDGEDLAAVLFHGGSRRGSEFIYFMGDDQRAYQKDGWKVKRPFAGFPGAPWKQAVEAHDTLLFDLRKDPGENNNLAAEHTEKLAQMIRAMDSAVEQLGPLPPSIIVRTPADTSHFNR